MDDLDEHEKERLRRQEYIRGLREEAQKREPISEADRLRAREYRREAEAQRERELDANRQWISESIASDPERTSSHDDVSAAWNAWFDSRFHINLEPMMSAVGKHLAEQLDAEREVSRDELAQEVKRLWCVVSELQATIRAFNRIQSAEAGSPASAPHETIQ
jgi:hypothetical protein